LPLKLSTHSLVLIQAGSLLQFLVIKVSSKAVFAFLFTSQRLIVPCRRFYWNNNLQTCFCSAPFFQSHKFYLSHQHSTTSVGCYPEKKSLASFESHPLCFSAGSMTFSRPFALFPSRPSLPPDLPFTCDFGDPTGALPRDLSSGASPLYFFIRVRYTSSHREPPSSWLFCRPRQFHFVFPKPVIFPPAFCFPPGPLPTGHPPWRSFKLVTPPSGQTRGPVFVWMSTCPAFPPSTEGHYSCNDRSREDFASSLSQRFSRWIRFLSPPKSRWCSSPFLERELDFCLYPVTQPSPSPKGPTPTLELGNFLFFF